MEDYTIASIIDYCRATHPITRLNSQYRYWTYIKYKTIYAKARTKLNIYTITKRYYDNEFQKALYKVKLGLYCRTPIDNMFDKCTKYQDEDEIGF